MPSRQRGAVVFILMAVIALAIIGFGVYALSQVMRVNSAVNTAGPRVPAARSDAPFAEAWSVALNPPLVHEMAAAPGRPGEFLALNRNEILRFDSKGTRVAKFVAPPKTTRIATDATGVFPYVMAVSSRTKWTGAITHTDTTDYFLHALNTGGREVWQNRFDPKDVSAPEPVITRAGGTSVILFSAGERLHCFDVGGRQLWDVPFWHHPGTVSATITGEILAAQAPMKNIVRIDSRGSVVGQWGKGEGPRRFRTMSFRGGTYAISLRHVTGGRQAGSDVVAFFDGAGTLLREIDLPRDAGFPTYWPIATVDADGTGRRNWVVALADGTIFVYSPDGEQLARHQTGSRLRTVIAVAQSSGPDLLITSTHTGLTAWRPIARRMEPPR